MPLVARAADVVEDPLDAAELGAPRERELVLDDAGRFEPGAEDVVCVGDV